MKKYHVMSCWLQLWEEDGVKQSFYNVIFHWGQGFVSLVKYNNRDLTVSLQPNEFIIVLICI